MHYAVLLIDFDGVLRHWPESDAEIETAHGLPVGAIRKAAFASERLEPVITGMTPDEAWRRDVARYLGDCFPRADAAAAVARWSKSSGKVDAQVLALLQQCMSALRTVLATNATSRLPQDLATLGLSAQFHAIANSSELGVMKPQAEFYRRALQRIDVPPQRALYVDDSAANAEAAAALGITAHRFVGCAALREFLHRAGAIES